MQPKRLKRVMLFSGAAFFICACSNNNFSPYGTLGTMQVLTLKANTPEVNPGASVNLQPVVSDTNGGGRTLSYFYATCPDPGISLGLQPQCTTPDTTGSGTFADASLGSNNTYTGLAPALTINVPASPANYASAQPYQQFNGVAYLVVYTLSAPDGTSVTAFKRIMVSSNPTKNQNPAISAVTDNGMTLGATNSFNTSLANLIPAFSVGAETYQTENSDGSFSTQTENLFTTWFYTDGAMEYIRTSNVDTNQWTPTANASRGEALVVVAHDGRGGDDYQIFVFN